MDAAIFEMTSTATLAIALFGAVFCLMQTQHARVNQSLALFLGAVAVNNLPDAFVRFAEGVDAGTRQSLDMVLWSPSSLCLAPLFWIYVHTLTSPAGRRPRRLYRHFILYVLAVGVGVLIVIWPGDILTALHTDADETLSGGAIVLILLFSLVHLATFPQIGIYLFLIVRRMTRFRMMLRDVYASTEQHELRWIVAIGVLGAVFWAAAAVLLVVQFDPERAEVTRWLAELGSVAGLAFVATVTLWGVRQRPPLVPDAKDMPCKEAPLDPPMERRGGKYEKSALSPEASSRIAGKLRAAMEKDNLHRDPNLSLWALARHIGASPNYISQTLNEVIGESFFDFVNGYRIAEAMTLLSTTNASVLTITYDVGFNARSSFYNAFKRVSGQTPSAFRKALSHPAGMDDLAQ